MELLKDWCHVSKEKLKNMTSKDARKEQLRDLLRHYLVMLTIMLSAEYSTGEFTFFVTVINPIFLGVISFIISRIMKISFMLGLIAIPILWIGVFTNLVVR